MRQSSPLRSPPQPLPPTTNEPELVISPETTLDEDSLEMPDKLETSSPADLSMVDEALAASESSVVEEGTESGLSEAEPAPATASESLEAAEEWDEDSRQSNVGGTIKAKKE